MLRDAALPLAATYYPLGFPLELATNSRDVIDAASEAWAPFIPEFDAPPIRLRVSVQAEGAFAAETVFRAQEHLFVIVSDRDNLGMFDPDARFGFCCVSAATAADHAWFRWHFLEAIVYMMLAQRDVTPVHGACVARNGAGVLLCGNSGAGKSTLAYACARAGWTFVADDTVMLVGGRVGLGKPQARFCHDAPQFFPEFAGYAARQRPNGKIAMEVALSDVAEVQTALRCSIDQIVFLERRPGIAASAEPLTSDGVLDSLLSDGPSYGNEVLARHAAAIREIASMPAWRMRYDTLEGAIQLLDKLR